MPGKKLHARAEAALRTVSFRMLVSSADDDVLKSEPITPWWLSVDGRLVTLACTAMTTGGPTRLYSGTDQLGTWPLTKGNWICSRMLSEMYIRLPTEASSVTAVMGFSIDTRAGFQTGTTLALLFHAGSVHPGAARFPPVNNPRSTSIVTQSFQCLLAWYIHEKRPRPCEALFGTGTDDCLPFSTLPLRVISVNQ